MDKKLNILYFFSYKNSFSSWEKAGILEREMELFERLNQKYQINFIFFSYNSLDETKYLKLFDSIQIINLNTLFNSSNSISFFKTLLIPFKIKKLNLNIDLIHQNQLNGSWVSIITKLILKKPLLIRTGYDMHQFAIDEEKHTLKIFLYKLLTRVSVSFADKFTVSSKTDLKKFKNSKKNIILLRNWSNSLNNIEFKDRPTNEILSVGRLVDQKNYKKLILDFKNTYEEYRLVIVGEGEKKEELQYLAKQNNVNVVFKGKIKNSELKEFYQKFKFFISCSKFEGNPKALIEAMGAGCVVLTSNISNHSEIIEQNINGILFDINNSNVKNVFINSIKLDIEKISFAASAKIKEEYHFDKICDTVNDIYNLLV